MTRYGAGTSNRVRDQVEARRPSLNPEPPPQPGCPKYASVRTTDVCGLIFGLFLLRRGTAQHLDKKETVVEPPS